MKKFLLFAFAVAAAMNANAQAVSIVGPDWCSANGSADGGATAFEVAAGTVICSIDGAAEMANGATTTFKIAGSTANGFNAIDADGMVVDASLQAVQGQDNPRDADGGNGWQTFKAPATGAFLKITAQKNGYLAVVAKYSSNKNYTVFEEGTCIPYTLAMEWGEGVAAAAAAGVTGATDPLVYTLPGVDVGDGVIAYDQSNGSILWPEQIIGVSGDVKKNGLGVIIFPVYEGCIYDVNAWGSKIAPQGMIFSETPFQKIKVTGTDAASGEPVEKVLYTATGTGIQNVAAAENATVAPVKVVKNGQIMIGDFNIAGQRVK
ncbi:MAG: hypothetical protein NC344_05245 [Bacteroidales bacterium]|nr:hypothetical protein [Bacteroidales bacterium]MCM1147228.1 hypothetical protein [Bacteroidales bacterium]MCM1207237.1 hypothetical protein [Bacillota bacterium]MCM1509742.1 hypothetical protein [Clostridium sp.]